MEDLREYLDKIKADRDNWGDEIPPEEVHFGNFKCRTTWFAGVIVDIRNGLDYGFVDENTERLYQDFLRHMRRTNLNGRLANEEDIRKANEILTSLIGHLEG